MTNPYRAVCAELHTAIQLYTGQNPAAANVPPAELVCRLMDAMAASAALLAQPEPKGLTDEELPEPPSPISAHDLAIQWNRQADQSEQWDSLELYEQLAWAQARAIAADRALPTPSLSHAIPTPNKEN